MTRFGRLVGHEVLVDVARVPVEQLVAVVRGHHPGLGGRTGAQLAVQGKGVRHVDLGDVPGYLRIGQLSNLGL